MLTTTLPPRAITHQEAIVRAIVKTFELSVEDLEALQRGGSRPLEKLVRSYHYWATEYNGGICPYDHPRLGYFRMTERAAKHDGATKELHCEHIVPVKWIVTELMRIRKEEDRPPTTVRVANLMTVNEIIIVMKDEARQMDRHGRSTMPLDWRPPRSHLVRLENCLQIAETQLIGVRLIGPVASAA